MEVKSSDEFPFLKWEVWDTNSCHGFSLEDVLVKKMSGSYLKLEYVDVILQLPDDQLFSAAEIAARKYSLKNHREAYIKMRNCVWQLGGRNQLSINPDNAIRDKRGKAELCTVGPRMGKPRLLPGEIHAKFLGKTWKEILFDEDKERVERWNQMNAFQKTLFRCHQSLQIRWQSIRRLYAKKLAEARVRERERMPGWKRATWVTAFVLGISLLPAAVTSVRYGPEALYEVLRREGPMAALKMTVSSKNEGYELYFASAWAYYEAKEYDRANFILKDIAQDADELSNSLNARVHFVEGVIATLTYQFDSANFHLGKSRSFYSLDKNTEGMIRVAIEEVRIQWLVGESDKALAALQDLEANVVGSTAQEIQKLLFLTYFDLGEFEQSLNYAEKLLNCGSISDEIQARSYIGLCYLHLGDYQEARQYAMEADARATSTGDPALLNYLLLNKLFLAKCDGLDFTDVYNRLRRWAFSKSEFFILHQLNLVDKFACP